MLLKIVYLQCHDIFFYYNYRLSEKFLIHWTYYSLNPYERNITSVSSPFVSTFLIFCSPPDILISR